MGTVLILRLSRVTIIVLIRFGGIGCNVFIAESRICVTDTFWKTL
jgi:hypothetical protein